MLQLKELGGVETKDRGRIDEIAADFLTDYRLNQRKSLKKAEQVTEHLKSDFRGYRITQITTPKIQVYIEHRLSKGVEGRRLGSG